MIDNYFLMHKEDVCGMIGIDRDNGALSDFETLDSKYTPFLGNADGRLMKIWWKHRAVPGNRKDIMEAIKRAGCETNAEYLAKNLALSLTDTYWICPVDVELHWDDVKLYGRRSAGTDLISYQGGSSYDPNASLGGEMDKYWDVNEEMPVLKKKSFQYGGQQSVNEGFATLLHIKQSNVTPFVSYEVEKADDGGTLSCCDAFTSEKIEFISAYEIIRSRKQCKSRSDFDHYLDVCEEAGLDRSELQTHLDYLILSDFAISNVDEHLGNFGLLRDTVTMEIVGPAPVFDSGNSMFFNIETRAPFSRIELLSLDINSIHKKEELMLKHVSNRTVLNYEALPGRGEVADYYRSNGMDNARAAFIADSYSNKLSLLEDFQSGINISLYNEKS